MFFCAAFLCWICAFVKRIWSFPYACKFALHKLNSETWIYNRRHITSGAIQEANKLTHPSLGKKYWLQWEFYAISLVNTSLGFDDFFAGRQPSLFVEIPRPNIDNVVTQPFTIRVHSRTQSPSYACQRSATRGSGKIHMASDWPQRRLLF